MAINRVRAGRGNQIDIQSSVTTGKHRWIRKDVILALCLLQLAPQCADYCDSKSECWMNGALHCCLPQQIGRVADPDPSGIANFLPKTGAVVSFLLQLGCD